MRGTNGPRKNYGDALPIVEASILDLTVCDCAGCGKELAGNSPANVLLLSRLVKTVTHQSLPQVVCRRINDRPFCRQCCIDEGIDESE